MDDPQTLEALQAKVIELTASVDETLREKKDQEAAIKKAEDDSKDTEKETNAAIKSAEDDSKEKLEKKIAAIKKASEETDPEKRDAAIKKANNDNDTKKEANEELEKKVQQQAEKIDEMEKKASKPVLTYLANIYKNTLPEDKFTEFMASWKKMSLTQLDNEIIKAQASLPKEEHYASVNNPMAPSQSIFEKSGSTEKTGTDKIDSADAVDLFNKSGGPYN